MTEVHFHLHIADVGQHLHGLLQQARGRRAALLAQPEQLQALSYGLMASHPSALVPHAWAEWSQFEQDAGLLVLVPPDALEAVSPNISDLWLLHPQPEPPAGFERFERLIELVPTDEVSVRLARERWKYYQHRAYPLQHHDCRPS